MTAYPQARLGDCTASDPGGRESPHHHRRAFIIPNPAKYLNDIVSEWSIIIHGELAAGAMIASDKPTSRYLPRSYTPVLISRFLGARF